MTQEEIKVKVDTLRRVGDTPPVKLYLDAVKALREELIISFYNEKGEEAVRALGTVKGLDMALDIESIYKARLTK